MRLPATAWPPRAWRLQGPAGSLVAVASQQVPVLAWLRVAIFSLVIAMMIVAMGLLVHRLVRGPPPAVPETEDGVAGGPLNANHCQGNVLQTCGVCQQVLPMEALIPCGHMLCGGCRAQVGTRCPFCRGIVEAGQPVFQP
uniref:RING-type domain-containing protein n=1 Tax=Alexandrium catenella TaxID=2925 RepID=A0A7S1WIB3_ALECA|mmetsp:Transcript_63945/g.170727  ORF Transcript_63945/g.170727 Transcript_63945/m.170727 type:complete len:140 (+) Transcript_63945:92-511(+)